MKISGKLYSETFSRVMQRSQPWFKLFAYSGILIFLGLLILVTAAILLIRAEPKTGVIDSQQVIIPECT